MKASLLTVLFMVSLLAGGCSKPHSDPVESAFRQKFDALRLGMTQAEVRNSLGEPSFTQLQIEDADDMIKTETGTIQIHKGDSTRVWVYTSGRNHYTLWFAARNTNDMSTGVLFMQNDISVGDTVRIK